ncbi:MAG: glycosyl hydrolase family 8 [Chitinivibrionales bacterium]
MRDIKGYLLLVVTVFSSGAAILPIVETLPSVERDYDQILLETWNGIKERNIESYSIKAVHRPKSEMPGDFVSEGIGYGLLCALYANDQETFNQVLSAGEEYMWTEEGGYYNWRRDESGGISGENWDGAATDAEEDIAVALIFAHRLVERGYWESYNSPNYKDRAERILETFWNSLVEDGKYVRPGFEWGGQSHLNPSYFAPAFYRVFDEFDSESGRNWSGLIDQCYATIEASPGYERGLVPDWCQADGEYTDGTSGYNGYDGGQHMYKDGIRVLWRIATDYLWYKDARAKEYLENAFEFIGSPENANFYQMDGSVVEGEYEIDGVTRPRAEHSHLTLGMWAPVALCVGSEAEAEEFSDALLEFYEDGADYWGKASDPDGEDTLHNELYFDQFLAWYGASLISGVFTNIWEDMKDPDPSTPVDWIEEPSVDTPEINGAVQPLVLTGEYSKSARWSLSITRKETGDEVYITSDRSESLSFVWYGLDNSGGILEPGWYDLVLSTQGLDEDYKTTVWLGKSLDLYTDNGLIIDDFSDGNLDPWFGSWESYLDNSQGGASSVTEFVNVEDSDKNNYLSWVCSLDEGDLGFEGFAALDWNSAGMDLEGLEEIVVDARSNSDLGVSAQLLTSDINDYNYFEDSLDLSSSWSTYTLNINDFTQRWEGSQEIDLSKLTGIRFQYQGPNGSVDLEVASMYLNGSFSYQDPGAFEPMPEIPVRYRKQSAGVDKGIGVLISGNRLSIKGMDSEYRAALVDPSGRCIRDMRLKGRGGIDLSGLSSGVYILSVKGRKAGFTRKLILQGR